MFLQRPPMSPMSPAAQLPPAADPPLDSIQRIAPSSTGAALLATRMPSCAPQGAGCHIVPERGCEAATVVSCASRRARARKGRAERQQVGGRSHDVGLEPVPVAPAAPKTREGQPWNMRLGDRKRPELPQLQRSRRKSLMPSGVELRIRPVVTSYGRRPGGGGGRGPTTRKSGTGQPPPQKIPEMAHPCSGTSEHTPPLHPARLAGGA